MTSDPLFRKGKFSTRNYKGFTLAEMMVVIVIFSILGGIGFVSIAGYLAGARDTTRLSDMNNIYEQLDINRASNGKYLIPENIRPIALSGVIISYQGYVGKKTLDMIQFDKGGKDPKDNTYYTYIIDTKKKRAQLMGYFEEYDTSKLSNGSGILASPYVAEYGSYVDRKIGVLGKNICIFTESGSLVPAQEASTGVLDVAITNTEYVVYCDNSIAAIGTGSVLSSIIKNGSVAYSPPPISSIVSTNKIIDFETESDYVVTEGTWIRTNTEKNEGSYSFESGNHDPGSSSCFEITTNQPDSFFVNFDYKVSGSPYSDSLEFYSNGNFEAERIGEKDWGTYVSPRYPAGNYTFKWCYYRGSWDAGEGQDRAWVDIIRIQNADGSLVGVCGRDSKKHLYATPTNACAVGAPNGVTDGGILSNYTWSCEGIRGGSSVNCSGRHSFGWLYNPVDIRDIFSNYSIYTEPWIRNHCNPSTMSVVDVSPGNDTIPSNLVANTIYRLAPGNYIHSGSITSANCSAIVGSGDSILYTLDRTEKQLIVADYTILSGIKLDGLTNGYGVNHATSGGFPSSKSNSTGIAYLGGYNRIVSVYDTEIYNMVKPMNSFRFSNFRNIKVYNNLSSIFDGYLHGSIVSNVDIYNTSGTSFYIDGADNNVYSNIKSYNNNSGIRFGYDDFSSMSNILVFNNNSGINFEMYYGILSNIYSWGNNSSTVGIRGYIYDDTGGSNDSSLHNLYAYNNLGGIYFSPSDSNTYLYGMIKSFGNSNFNFTGGTVAFGSGSLLGFGDGTTLEATGTFGTDWVAQPSVAGWNYSLKGKQALTFSGGIIHTYGSNIGNQVQPKYFDDDTNGFEQWGTDGIHFDSTKKVGEW